MSPSSRPHLPNNNSNINPNHPIVDHAVESSNSTASIFLGGVRRNWMRASQPQSNNHHSTTPTTTIAASSPSSPSTNSASRQHPHGHASPVLASAVASPPPTINACPPQGMRNPASRPPNHQSHRRVPSNLSAHTASPTVAVPAPSQNAVLGRQKGFTPTTTGEASLMSPVTPGATLQHPDATLSAAPVHPYAPAPIATTTTTATAPTSEVTTTLDGDQYRAQTAHQFPSLPSPDPSTSHTSPTSAVEGNGDNQLHATIPSSASIQNQVQSQPQGSPVVQQASAHVRSNSRGVSSPRQAGGGGLTQVMNQGRPLQNFAPQTVTADSDVFWATLVNKMDLFVVKSNESMGLSETVELPRVRLLRDACNSQDLLYLVLHQIYCLSTFAPSELPNIMGFGSKHLLGLEVIKQLLVDNTRLSGDFLKWAVHFPFPLQQMLHFYPYQSALAQGLHALAFLSDRWAGFDVQVRARGFPPLIDELVVQFGITSSVMLSIVFLAMCRRLYGPNHEGQLRKLFLKNKTNYDRRFDRSQVVSKQQMQQENESLINAFRALTYQVQGAPASSPSVNTAPLVSTTASNNEGSSIQQPASQPSTGPAPPPTSHSPTPVFVHNGASVPPNTPSTHPHQPPPPPQHWPQSHMQQVRPPNAIPVRMVPSPAMNVNITVPPTPTPVPMPAQQQAGHGRSQSNTRVPGGTSQPMRVHQYQSPYPHAQTQAQAQSHPPTQPQPQLRFQPPYQAQPQPQLHPQLQPQSQPQPQFQSRYRLPHTSFLPQPGWIPPNAARPNALRLALHQAHLRDPMQKLNCPETSKEEEAELFYYLTSFLLPPTFLGREQCAYNWQLTLSREDCEKFPRTNPGVAGYRTTRTFSEGCRSYRLRCIKVSPSQKDIEQHTWSTADSVWPSVIYIFVNSVELYVRRKLHNGKDLPLDITDHLHEGVNNVSLHFIRNTAESKDLVYALGVEVMDVSGFSRVKELARTVPASDSRQCIQQRLQSSAADDELSIVNDDLSVDVVDPFMARIFDVPARGENCAHLECFDLDTFLKTRASRPGKGPMKDNWKCPICTEDARPQRLLIDGFLAEVRAELERTNRLEDATTVTIKKDGSWELKNVKDNQANVTENERPSGAGPLKRKRNGLSSSFSPASQRPKTAGQKTEGHPEGNQGTPNRESRAAEVIELD